MGTLLLTLNIKDIYFIINIVLLIVLILLFLFIWNTSTQTEKSAKLLNEILENQKQANDEMIMELKEINNKLNKKE